ncbi:MAG TPA: pro-sigmaK processing inhibitor BofA family protein [Clostridia bacterium]|jgi:inhibitor of the pro-sigma K processing machinery|nr:pro-sigmaK processing inhibitor BofA family protein [Clostridia bacterium]
MGTLYSLLAFAAGIFVLWLICKLLSVPLKIIWKLLVNAVIGAVVLLIFNFFGGIVGFTIPISPVSALVAGILGIPGVIILALIEIF